MRTASGRSPVSEGDANVTEQTKRKQKWLRRARIALGIYLLHYILFGYHFLSGKVVDEESGKPIEGAVVLGAWTHTVRFGLEGFRGYKTEDAVTGKNGRFFIWGVWNPLINRWLPLVDSADLVVYKRGYVAWNNVSIFKNGPRTDFEWKNGLVVKMEKWKDEYSFIQHESFISGHTFPAMTLRFAAAMDWETDFRVRERDQNRNEKKRQERGR